MDARVKDTAAIDSAIDAALAEKRIVGGVVLVMQDGEIAYRRAAGLADRERAAPMREDAVFRLASLTKPLVTAAALRMVELGKIALADPVTRYLPDFRPALPNGEVPAITLRHLLTHTAGLVLPLHAAGGGAYERAGVSDGADEPGPLDDREPEAHRPRRALPIRRARRGPIRSRWTCSARCWRSPKAQTSKRVIDEIRERAARRAVAELRPDRRISVTRLVTPYADGSARAGAHSR